MKIYINNLNLEALNKIEHLCNQHLTDTKSFIALYTDQGTYRIEDKKIYQLNVVDIDIKIYNNYYKNFSLIVDPSYFIETQTNSVHGETHISFKKTRKIYKFNGNSTVQLVIEYDEKFRPNDIYFELHKNVDIDEILIKGEIIEFLSMLN